MIWFINYFHLQILALELILCWHLPHRKLFFLRLLPMTALYCALPFVVPGGFFSPYVQIGWFTFGFLIMLILSALIIWGCFRIGFKQVVFYACVAHTMQHIVHCIGQISSHVFKSMPSDFSQTVELFFMIGVLALAYYFVKKHIRGSDTSDLKSNYLIAFAIISTLLVYVVSYWTTSQEYNTLGVQIFDLLSCHLIMMILLDMFKYRKAEKREMILSQLLKQEQDQHRMSKETVEVINRKCHDLKHQISALRRMDDSEREKSIKELEKAVMIYDRFAKSGNEDLDIILAEKSLICENKNILLQCIVDGKLLGFMKTEDMYILLGNALDNAIESTSLELNDGKKIITFMVSKKAGAVSIHIENPCRDEPVFIDNLPLTTKSDKEYHGFGVQSMRYIAEKYGGTLVTSWEDGIFSLDLLFPET